MMSKYVACPKYVEHCLNDDLKSFKDILIALTTSHNEFKLVLDDGNVLLNNYKKLKDINGFLSLWLKLLTPGDTTYNVELQTDLSLNIKSFVVELIKKISDDKHLIIHDIEDYTNLELDSIIVHDINSAANIFSYVGENAFLQILLSSLSDLIERKQSLEKLENVFNDHLTTMLRSRNLNVSDQTRTGQSESGSSPGSLDIAIREIISGNPTRLIEAFSLNSFNRNNRTIARHINKLIENYNPTGVSKCYIVAYYIGSDFLGGWERYKQYLDTLEDKPDFTSAYKPTVSSEISTSSNSIKRLDMTHSRGDNPVQVKHFFIDLS